MTAPALRLSPTDQDELVRKFDSDLKHGRAFAEKAEDIEVLADCRLVLVHPDGARELELTAQAVMVTPGGVGVELRPFDEDVKERIRQFVEGALPEDPAQEPVPREADDTTEAGAQARPSSHAPDKQRQRQRPRHERLRKLSSADQHKLARKGELNDRVMLERLYGRNVWEALLQNPRLTIPEVARIARKGTVPRPLLDIIVDNNAWVQAPIVRRALLKNPRVTGESIMKLLRLTPKHELKVIAKTTAYSTQIRESARKLLA